MKANLVSLAAVVVLALAAVGCSKKVPECNSVVDVIKKNSEAAAKGTDAAAAKANAEAADKAAASLAALTITTPEVKKFADEIAKSYKMEAEATRGLAAAGDDPVKMTAAAESLGKSGELLTKTVTEMDKFCAAP